MQKNKVSKTIGDRKKASKGKDKCEELVAESKGLDDAIAKADETADKATAELQQKINKVGNIVHPDIIVTKDEDLNKVMRTWGQVDKSKVADGSELGKMRHHEIMQCLGIIEMERGARIAGHRGYYLKGAGFLFN